MTRASSFTLFLVLCIPTVACDAEAESEEQMRGPIGKADLVGSCEMTSCDGVAPGGNCFCDSLCESFGDCCSDKAHVCDDEACCDPDAQPGVGTNPTCFEGASCCGDGTWACNDGGGQSTCAEPGTACEPAACCDPDAQPGVGTNPTCFEGASCCGDGTWACNDGGGQSTCAEPGTAC